jgi:hypothetical protein
MPLDWLLLLLLLMLLLTVNHSLQDILQGVEVEARGMCGSYITKATVVRAVHCFIPGCWHAGY